MPRSPVRRKRSSPAGGAASEPAVAAAKYHLKSATVAHLAQAVLDDIGPIAKSLGLTPQGAAQFVVARIGDLQKDLLKALGAAPNPSQGARNTE